MFAPLRTWRKWHRKVNTNQKRHAVAACLAASACAPLVFARGHRVDAVPELPLVANVNSAESTGAMLRSLISIGAGADLQRVRASKATRNGQGKMRNSRFTMRKGPLIVYNNDDSNVQQNARNMPGVDSCNVHRLNLLQLAPGGHLGRFVVYTPSAFAALDAIFGTATQAGVEKGGYRLNRTSMECADLARIINSDQVQSKLRAIRTSVRAHDKTKKNPLNNRNMMQRMNPNANAAVAAEAAAQKARVTARAAAVKHSRSKAGQAEKKTRTARFNALHSGLVQSFADADAILEQERKDGLIDESEEEEESDE
jgi:large subunit ribosomal protein L4e